MHVSEFCRDMGPSSLLMGLRLSPVTLFLEFYTSFYVQLSFVGQLSCKACVT